MFISCFFRLVAFIIIIFKSSNIVLLKSHNFSVTKYLSGLNINLENREEGEEKDLHYLFFLFPD